MNGITYVLPENAAHSEIPMLIIRFLNVGVTMANRYKDEHEDDDDDEVEVQYDCSYITGRCITLPFDLLHHRSIITLLVVTIVQEN